MKTRLWLLVLLSSLVWARDTARVRDYARMGGRSFAGGSFAGGQDLAFFEAFPSSGAGSGTACPLPNWTLQSEAFGAAEWGAASGGTGPPAVPVITANQATAPDGTLTADKVDFPSVSGAGYSVLYGATGYTSWIGSWTHSLYVKGVSGSGTIYLMSTPGGTYNSAACAYTSTDWTRCTVTGTETAAAWYLQIGIDLRDGAQSAKAAQSVYLWGAMRNQGATTGAYVKTTTVAAASQPTGAKGEVLTATRSSAAMCSKTATGGLATTGIANGDLVWMPSNMLRVEYDATGTLGALVESARTNSCLRSQEIELWTGDSGTAPTLNATNSVVAPDGTTTADEYTFPAVSGGGYSFRYQSNGCPVGVAASASVYAKLISGSETTLNLAMSKTGGTWDYASCTINASTWTRCVLENVTTPGANANFYVGHGTILTSPTMASARVALWGGQCENGAYVTSHLPTAGVAVARAGDAHEFAASGTWTYGSLAATVWYPRGNADKGWLGLSTTSFRTTLYEPTADAVDLYVDTVQRISTTTSPGSRRLMGYWSADSVGVSGGTSTTVTAMSVSETGSPNRLALLTYSSGAGPDPAKVQDGIISKICADPSPTRCQ